MSFMYSERRKYFNQEIQIISKTSLLLLWRSYYNQVKT